MITAFRPPRDLAQLRRLVDEEPRARVAAFTIVVGLITALVLLIAPPSTVAYDAGTVADRAVRAPRSVSFTSESLTAAERERAAAGVPKQYARNPAVATTEVGRIQTAVAAIGRVRAEPVATRDQRVAALTRIGDAPLTPILAGDVADMPNAEWDQLARELENVLRTLYSQDIRAEQLEQARTDAPKALPSGWTDRQKRVAGELLRQHLTANVAIDEAATQAAQQVARAGVVPVQVQVTAGEVVVRQGQAVTGQDVEKLRALGLVSTSIDWRGAVGLLLWALLIAGVLALFVERYAQEAWSDDRRLILMALSLLALTVAGRLLVPGHAVAVYAAPFAAVAMMLTVLIGGRTALATQIAGALHVGVMSGQVEILAYVLVPALLGMAAVRRATSPREFVTGALNVTLGNVGVIAAFLLVSKTVDIVGILQLAGAAVASGALSGLLAYAASAILGHLLRITTVFELRELADPNHPLLKQMLLRTPGTYHHSLLVGNLAERAAEVIGADPLIARVGAYYHDIGKMRNPSAFIENQTGTNPHDDLDPAVSAGIVAAHVRDGIALAERYKLPMLIREIIPAHHGTGLVKYFHQLAQQRGGPIDEEAFRYPGPRARSKEAGIVMLADGVEASVRSLEEKTQARIRAMVEKIVSERVGEGQLDDCDLTLRDVQRIKDAFVELLAGVYHERIPYPEDRIARMPSPSPAAPPPAASQR